ncbi:MAG: hypothetical protein N2C14_23975, partial [Planctomycetales bacterium]
PREHHLRFVEPVGQVRVARGQPLEFRLVDDDGSPPGKVVFQTRRRDPQTGRITEEPPQVMQSSGKRELFLRKDAVSDSFEFRATGGDDQSMEWRLVEAVDPPKILSLVVTLHPPEYTGRQPAVSDPRVRALVGTRVVLQASANKDLRSVALRIKGQDDLPAKIQKDDQGLARSFSAEFTLEQSGTYWFRLEDAEGFLGGDARRYELRAEPDETPTVLIDRPSTHLPVTVNAVVPLDVIVRDDLGIQAAYVAHVRGEPDSPEQVLPLLTAEPGKTAPTADEASAVLLNAGDRRKLSHRWDLSQLDPPLEPGTELIFHAVATDYKGQTGKSSVRRLTGVMPEQMADRIANRQSVILGELKRLLNLSQESRRQVRLAEIQLDKVGQFNKQDHDHLQAAELGQRQVLRGLTDRQEGVPGLIREMLTDLENNRLEDPDLRERMDALSQGMQALADGELPRIAAELTNVLKLAQTELSQDDDQPQESSDQQGMLKSLRDAGTDQDRVVASLQAMLKELAQWDDARRFRNELRRMQQTQQRLAGETGKMVNKTLTQNVEELSPEFQADLFKNAAEQRDLARQLAHTLRGMEQSGSQLREDQPRLAELLGDALAEARDKAVSGKMRTAASEVEKNNVGHAALLQKKIADDLRDLLDTLTDRPERNLAKLVEKLRKAEEDLERLRDRQEQLAKKIAEAAGNPNAAQKEKTLKRLRAEQEQLRKESERFARRLRRLEAEQSRSAVAKASGEMQAAEQQAGDAQGQNAAEQAQQAKKDLEDAAQKLTARRRQAEAELAFEELMKIKDQLAGLKTRQIGVNDQTQALEKRRAPDAPLTDPQRATVASLADAQQQLQDETQAVARKLTAAEAFSLALRGAAGEMQHAADLLHEKQTADPVQVAQANARRRLELLLEALERDPPEGQQQPPSNQGEGSSEQTPPADAISMLAQIKLIKLLQEEINLRTALLEERIGEKQDLTEDEQREFARLGREQGMLSDLMENLPVPADEPPENDPESLPELENANPANQPREDDPPEESAPPAPMLEED